MKIFTLIASSIIFLFNTQSQAQSTALSTATPLTIDSVANPNPFTLISQDFQNQQSLPATASCKKQGGQDQLPMLTWKNMPVSTETFVLTVTDPDAPNGHWVHLILYNIPKTTTFLNAESLTRYSLGINSFDQQNYTGPCHTMGKAHHYIFTLYALRQWFPTNPPLDDNTLQFVLSQPNSIFGQAQLVGLA